MIHFTILRTATLNAERGGERQYNAQKCGYEIENHHQKLPSIFTMESCY